MALDCLHDLAAWFVDFDFYGASGNLETVREMGR